MVTVVISSAIDASRPGGWAANGGTKLQEVWVKLLRRAGYEAYIATFDGTHPNWLIDHQPHVSIAQVAEWAKEGRDLRLMTTWLEAKAFIDVAAQAGGFYYFDAEIAWTLHPTFYEWFKQYRPAIKRFATHSRVQQGWYLGQGIDCLYIPEWSDTDFWHPEPSRRVHAFGSPPRVGFMSEPEHGAETARDITYLQETLARYGEDAEWECITGNEMEVLMKMQSCDVFLGMNRGKHPLFGEGCPRTQQEALHAGCLVIAYDVKGNREYLIDGYSGYLVPVGRVDRMAEMLATVLRDPAFLKMIQVQSWSFISRTFGPDGRLGVIREFLEL